MISTLLAGNPGPMTLEGTNTYVITGGGSTAVVVDPGPTDADHAALIRSVATPTSIMITHRHLDHAESTPALARDWAVPVLAADRDWCVAADPLRGGEVIDVDGVTITVISTPGHTDDSVSLLVEQPDTALVLLTGDTVLGRGTTVITHPDGDLGDYLTSLDVLADLIAARGVTQILPGHGPLITSPATTIADYLAHRHERLDQVRAALARGAETPEQVVDLVYAGIDPAVRPAALQSVRSQLDHLQRQPG